MSAALDHVLEYLENPAPADAHELLIRIRGLLMNEAARLKNAEDDSKLLDWLDAQYPRTLGIRAAIRMVMDETE